MRDTVAYFAAAFFNQSDKEVLSFDSVLCYHLADLYTAACAVPLALNAPRPLRLGHVCILHVTKKG